MIAYSMTTRIRRNLIFIFKIVAINGETTKILKMSHKQFFRLVDCTLSQTYSTHSVQYNSP